MIKTFQLKKIGIVGSETFPDRAFSWKEPTDWVSITFEVNKEDIKKIHDFINNKAKKSKKYDLIIVKYPLRKKK